MRQQAQTSPVPGARYCHPAWALAIVLLTGCSRSSCAGPPSSDRHAIDEPLLAYLSLARSSHHQADLAEDEGHPDESLAALQALIATARPGDSPEVHEVLADTHARLADLLSKAGRYAEAVNSIEEGLRHATEPSYFRGHLFEMRGVTEERYAKDLQSKGDAPAAELARERARQALATAITIQEQVIARGLRDRGSR